MASKLPQIPAITADNTLAVLQAMKEIIEIRSGQRESAVDRWATLAELPIQQPGCLVRLTANQSIASSVVSIVNLNATDWAQGGMRIDPVNPGRIVIPKAGVYLLVGSMCWETNVVGSRYINFFLNGKYFHACQYTNSADGTGRNNIPAIVRANRGDYLQVIVFQDSGSTLNLLGGSGNDTATLAVQFLSP